MSISKEALEEQMSMAATEYNEGHDRADILIGNFEAMEGELPCLLSEGDFNLSSEYVSGWNAAIREYFAEFRAPKNADEKREEIISVLRQAAGIWQYTHITGTGFMFMKAVDKMASSHTFTLAFYHKCDALAASTLARRAGRALQAAGYHVIVNQSYQTVAVTI